MVTATDEVSGNKLNVIIFGTDSVSRLNFHRVNPKTYNYLTKELNALEYGGYNKIGDNTLPNFVPLLSGLTVNEFVNNCTKGSSRPIDNCTFIWKDFHRNGYITSFVEDRPDVAVLSIYLPGFFLQPTDHYTRPGFLAAEEIFKNINECFGNKLTYEVLHAYSQDFEFTYQNRSTFSFIWGTGLTHDNHQKGRFTDEPHTRYLKNLKEGGFLNRTILFFISDHGIRFGKYRGTYMGKYEENLPYLFIVVPEWFKKRYPLAYKNLRENTLKFLTPFDIHETLLDIVHERYNDSSYYTEEQPQSIRSISLFKKLPINRTCKDVGVPLTFCACQGYVFIKTNSSLEKKIVEYLKGFLNKILKEYRKCKEIESMKLRKVMKSQSEINSSGKSLENPVLIVYAAYKPGDAQIEVTIKWDQNNKVEPFQASRNILRINRYGTKSHCVKDPLMVKICICRENV